MNGKYIFSFLRVAFSILYYLMIVVALCFIVFAVIQLVQDGKTGERYSSEVMGFGTPRTERPFTYSTDSLVRYQPVKNKYTIEIASNSAAGYYTMIMKLLLIGLAIAVLWNFKKIFQQTRLDDPFTVYVIRRLKMLAILFVASDVLKIIDYLLFNSFLRRSITSPHFELVTEVGNGIITGLIIWIIVIIFQRGRVLQEENALTV